MGGAGSGRQAQTLVAEGQAGRVVRVLPASHSAGPGLVRALSSSSSSTNALPPAPTVHHHHAPAPGVLDQQGLLELYGALLQRLQTQQPAAELDDAPDQLPPEEDVDPGVEDGVERSHPDQCQHPAPAVELQLRLADQDEDLREGNGNVRLCSLQRREGGNVRLQCTWQR